MPDRCAGYFPLEARKELRRLPKGTQFVTSPSLRSVLLNATAALFALTVSLAGITAAQAAPPASFAPSEVLVGVRADRDDDETRGRIEKAVGPILRRQGKIRSLRVKVRAGLTVEQAIARLGQVDGVAYAEPNATLVAFGTPNDPYYSANQYAPQKVQANLAWDLWNPKAQTLVAIVDTGVQANHPDLAGKVVGGYDFANNDGDPSDDHGHGTHCAGIAAAHVNNGTGIAGISGWASTGSLSDTYTRVLPVKVLSASGSGYTSAVADGIVYAADQGATVISLSLGGGSSYTLQNAVNYAYSKGCVLVAAAGNDGSSGMAYPGGYPNVLSVASTDENDTLSGFSNYGSWVKVAAPGERIASTMPGSSYAYMSGTSMATPLVAGQAALIRAHNPALSNAEVEAAIVGTTDPYNPYGSRTIAGGRVNVYRSLLAATPPSDPTPPQPEPLPEPEPGPAAPAAPTNLIAQAASRSQVNLTWTDNSANETGFVIERSLNGSAFTTVTTVGVDVRNYSDTGRDASTFYYYRVRAFNATGDSGYSNTAKARTPRK